MHGYEIYIAYSDIFSVIPSHQFPRCQLISIIWTVICLLTALRDRCRVVWMVVCVFKYFILGNACPMAEKDIVVKRTEIESNGWYFAGPILKDIVLETIECRFLLVWSVFHEQKLSTFSTHWLAYLTINTARVNTWLHIIEIRLNLRNIYTSIHLAHHWPSDLNNLLARSALLAFVPRFIR